MRLDSKSIYFSRDSLCFTYFDVIVRQRLKKKNSRSICKLRHWNLGIGIGNGIGIGTGTGTDTTNAIISSNIRPMDTNPSRVVT